MNPIKWKVRVKEANNMATSMTPTTNKSYNIINSLPTTTPNIEGGVDPRAQKIKKPS